jgi:hemerythrin-like domain-containing protein
MQDHGLLGRVLLVYEESMRRLEDGDDFFPLSLVRAAQVMSDYVVDYHQTLEEVYLFPRFRRSDTHVGLIEILRHQHDVGRRLTASVLDLGGLKLGEDVATRRRFAQVLGKVVRMYRPHEAREDTALFPLLRNVVSASEYDALGEAFERERTRRFGGDGFERFVGEISESEKVLGIYKLADFVAE